MALFDPILGFWPNFGFSTQFWPKLISGRAHVADIGSVYQDYAYEFCLHLGCWFLLTDSQVADGPNLPENTLIISELW